MRIFISLCACGFGGIFKSFIPKKFVNQSIIRRKNRTLPEKGSETVETLAQTQTLFLLFLLQTISFSSSM